MVMHPITERPPALSAAQQAALARLAAGGEGRPNGCMRPKYVQHDTMAALMRLRLVEAVENAPAPAKRRRVGWTTYRLTAAGRAIAPPGISEPAA